ncbi:uncharacterized protein SETTUDRAFT_38525 [Exserohilum turcica Et28A]|uniref:Uncharacterized protein n=1 Tax=Exserohilum turcicum (strain 28A) TaxID=671987 RepID=R0IUK7_EXST2|nr:uncharacterized protein SETTUDRAFT_38525 [Exserohilum turcica Et28A]EOA88480.1 hypothetical protein SETTUDRAFT_38525 [Exserohilum turcica Et28A]
MSRGLVTIEALQRRGIRLRVKTRIIAPPAPRKTARALQNSPRPNKASFPVPRAHSPSQAAPCPMRKRRCGEPTWAPRHASRQHRALAIQDDGDDDDEEEEEY